MKILVIGHARHGKDTVANRIARWNNLRASETSQWIAQNYMFDELKDQYNYVSPAECYDDRVNHRELWFNKIYEYNKYDPTRLCKDMLKENDIYVGIRSLRELAACYELFDHVVLVTRMSTPHEFEASCDIPISFMKGICTHHVQNDYDLQFLDRIVSQLDFS